MIHSIQWIETYGNQERHDRCTKYVWLYYADRKRSSFHENF